jgi:hypothetical protein
MPPWYHGLVSRKLLAHLYNPAQDVFLLCVFGLSVLPTLLIIEWIIAFSTFLKNNLRQVWRSATLLKNTK